MDYEAIIKTLDELTDVALRLSSQLLIDKHSTKPLSPAEKNSVLAKIMQAMHVLQINI